MIQPKLKAPALACDTHIHIYEDGFPLAPTATFKPPLAPVSEYRKVQQALGLQRAVVVQPTGYGFDNSCTLKAIAALGPNARGIAVVPPDVSDRELSDLARAGIRGVRYFMLKNAGGVMTWESLEKMAARIADYGWVVQLQLDGRELPQYDSIIARLRTPVIIDHNGKFLEPVTVDHPSFQSLLRLLDSGRVWAKMAAPYETSKIGAPGYDDVGALARALVKANPDRCVWGSNWPHPNAKPVPDNAAMLDLLLDWADDDATRHKILVKNPATLYGYE